MFNAHSSPATTPTTSVSNIAFRITISHSFEDTMTFEIGKYFCEFARSFRSFLFYHRDSVKGSIFAPYLLQMYRLPDAWITFGWVEGDEKPTSSYRPLQINLSSQTDRQVSVSEEKPLNRNYPSELIFRGKNEIDPRRSRWKFHYATDDCSRCRWQWLISVPRNRDRRL